MANKNISVVNVTTANEPVFSNSAEIQHLSIYNCYLQLKKQCREFWLILLIEDAFNIIL